MFVTLTRRYVDTCVTFSSTGCFDIIVVDLCREIDCKISIEVRLRVIISKPTEVGFEQKRDEDRVRW